MGPVVATLEDLRAGAFVGGLTPGGAAGVIDTEWFGDRAVKVTFEDSAKAMGQYAIENIGE